jgi:hypothetical protein
MGDMPVSATHEMVLIGPAESGAEEWACPSCGRRMMLRWPPHYEKLVLEHGDENVIHVGAKGGMRMGEVEVTPAHPVGVPEDELRWLNESGIDWGGTPA